MSNEINYKTKYLELRQKFMSSVDVAFRAGYEQGMKDAELQSVQQAQQAQAQPGMNPDQSQTPGQIPGQEPRSPEQPQQGGSELDQHIAELEGLLNKPDANKEDIQKALNNLKFGIEMKKSQSAITAIGKALSLTHESKEHEIVADVLDGFEKESEKMKKSANLSQLESILNKKL